MLTSKSIRASLWNMRSSSTQQRRITGEAILSYLETYLPPKHLFLDGFLYFLANGVAMRAQVEKQKTESKTEFRMRRKQEKTIDNSRLRPVQADRAGNVQGPKRAARESEKVFLPATALAKRIL